MGFFDKRALKKYTKEAEIVMSYEEAMKALSDDELKAKTTLLLKLEVLLVVTKLTFLLVTCSECTLDTLKLKVGRFKF